MAVTELTEQEIRALSARYGQAWNDHDVEAILALHAPETGFHLHVVGFEPAASRDAFRTQIELFFSAIPDLHFVPGRLTVRPGIWVQEFASISGTLAAPLPVGDQVAEVGGRFDVEGVDVMPLEGGLVRRKDTFLDGVAFARQLGVA